MTDFNFDYTEPQIWAQVELHYSIMATTMPSLHIFLKILQTGWLADLKDRPDTAMASKTIGTRYRSVAGVGSATGANKSSDRDDFVVLQDWADGKGQLRTLVRDDNGADDDSASYGSRTKILVLRTVDVYHGSMGPAT